MNWELFWTIAKISYIIAAIISVFGTIVNEKDYREVNREKGMFSDNAIFAVMLVIGITPLANYWLAWNQILVWLEE